MTIKWRLNNGYPCFVVFLLCPFHFARSWGGGGRPNSPRKVGACVFPKIFLFCFLLCCGRCGRCSPEGWRLRRWGVPRNGTTQGTHRAGTYNVLLWVEVEKCRRITEQRNTAAKMRINQKINISRRSPFVKPQQDSTLTPVAGWIYFITNIAIPRREYKITPWAYHNTAQDGQNKGLQRVTGCGEYLNTGRKQDRQKRVL